jgi:predicted nucleotidyltransferase
MEGEILEALTRYFADRTDSGVVSAYLFGSFAEGREHRESDVDVGVLLDWSRCPTARDRFERRIELISDLIAALHFNEVDVVILNDAPPLLGRKIVTGGTRVFAADLRGDLDYVRDVQLRAADLEPWLRRMARRKLEALAR